MSISYSPSKKGFYNDALQYKSLPDDLIPITKEEHERFLNGVNSGQKQLVVQNGTLTLVDKAPDPVTWDQVRAQRSYLLSQSDWTQMPDYSGANKSAWAVYRQELRDLPQKYATAASVVWPNEPK